MLIIRKQRVRDRVLIIDYRHHFIYTFFVVVWWVGYRKKKLNTYYTTLLLFNYKSTTLSRHVRTTKRTLRWNHHANTYYTLII